MLVGVEFLVVGVCVVVLGEKGGEREVRRREIRRGGWVGGGGERRKRERDREEGEGKGERYETHDCEGGSAG